MAERASVRNPVVPAVEVHAPAANVLDRVVGGLTVEQWVYAVVLIAAVVTRMYIAGVRPLHHDESIHAFFSWKIVTDGLGNYQYDPVYHGPVLYYWTALIFRLFGDSDFTARLSPIIFGLVLIGFAWPLRRHLGRWGALSYLVLVTFSPSFNYFSRFLRHDIYVAVFNLSAIYFAFRYAEERAARYLYCSFAALALSFCTKEDLYVLGPTMILSVLLTLLWEVVYASDWRRALRAVLSESGALLKGAVLPGITSAIIFAVIWLVFYTSFFTHPNNWNSVTKALTYWIGQHTIKRIGGPWWYYIPDLVVYEPLIFFPALLFLIGPLLRPRAGEGAVTRLLVYGTWIGVVAFAVCLFMAPYEAPLVLLGAATLGGLGLMRRWLPDRFTRFFCIWTLGCFCFYAWAQEKVPWLLVPVLLPMVILAAKWFGQLIEQRLILRPLTAVVLAALGGLTIWTLIASNYLYDAPRPAEAPGPRHAELLAYVQSTYDVTDVVMKRVEEVGNKLGTGTQTRLAVSGNATWPLSWYLRRYPVNWSADVRSVDTPVVIVDKEATKSLDEALGDKYEKVQFAIRGWWEPDWRQLDLTKLGRYLGTRVAYNPVGSSDAVMYVLKDLKPGTTLAPVAVNPPPAAHGYPRSPIQIQPVAVWGERGSGPGQFNEPRGLAVDRGGNLYVVDSKNNRVQKLAPDGHPLTTWGQEGDGEGKFKDPCGITVATDGSVFVADTWNHRIQKFDANGKFLIQFKEEKGFWGPRGIAVSPDGNSVYVTDTGNKRVVSFDANGKQLHVWGKEGSKPGELIEPVGIAVNAAGNVLVADTGNHRMQIFDAEGQFLREFFVNGWEEFYTEPYLAVLEGDELVVTDSYNHRAARYNNGTLVYSWGKSGNGRGDFNRPIGIAADAQGAVYVADTMNHRIEKFVLPPPGNK